MRQTRQRTGRELAYLSAIALCAILIVLLAVATGWGLAGGDGSDSMINIVAIFVCPAMMMFMGFILYGYTSDYRAERARGSTRPPIGPRESKEKARESESDRSGFSR